MRPALLARATDDDDDAAAALPAWAMDAAAALLAWAMDAAAAAPIVVHKQNLPVLVGDGMRKPL